MLGANATSYHAVPSELNAGMPATLALGAYPLPIPLNLAKTLKETNFFGVLLTVAWFPSYHAKEVSLFFGEWWFPLVTHGLASWSGSTGRVEHAACACAAGG